MAHEHQVLNAYPCQCWNDRLVFKEAPKRPDFRKKHTLQPLWVDFGWRPPWITTKIATLDYPHHVHPIGGLTSRWTNPCCNDGYEVVHALCNEGRLKDAVCLVERMVQKTMTREDAKTAYICLLKSCARKKALVEGKQVHALIAQSKCDSNIFLANNLIDMYGKCGSILDALMVFDAMPRRNVFSWTTIISAYVNAGKCEEAINLFKEMQKSGMDLDKVVFGVVLKACAKTADLEQGKQIHSLILKRGLEQDTMLQNILIDMYAKCGCLEDARELFNNMRKHDIFSWNVMIAGYVQNGLGMEALALYEQMEQEGMRADRITFVSILKACASTAALKHGRHLHSLILTRGLEKDVMLQNMLIDMYAKIGCLEDARELFDNMSKRDVFSWNIMISGYAQSGLGMEAFALYEQMEQEGIQANKVTFVCVLKACSSIAALQLGRHIHSLLLKRGLDQDVIVQSTLVDMYAKCRCLEDARELFNNMSERDVVSWNAMISGYAQNGLGKEALALYDQMKQEGMQANKVTYICVLTACANIGALETGKQVHSLILDKGFEEDVVVQNALIDMHAKCGCLQDAREIFNNMSERDVISWNTMISGYAQNGFGNEALALYGKMKQEGIQENKVTFVCLLKACATIAALEQGKQIHSLILERGFELDVAVQNTLLDMYAKCGCLEVSHELFNNMSERDVVSWNIMIAGYAQNGLGKEAFALYDQMEQQGMPPNKVTFVCVLKACAHIRALEQGKQIHTLILGKGFEQNVAVQNALVDMYATCGCLESARELFDNMSERNVVSWNAMISGYAQNGLGNQALVLYEQMKQEGMQADKITFVTVLNACANIAALEQGKQIHSFILETGLELDVVVQNTLVDMYAKCGSLESSRELFNNMTKRDVVSWNTMIVGYAQNGLGKEALSLYEQMEQECILPDYVTYTCILSACSHSGLVEEGFHVFYSMHNNGLTPTIKNYACMVDLLGRAGLLAETEDFIMKMPIQPNRVVWMSLLGAARNAGNVEIGQYAFDYMVTLEPESPTPYLLLIDTYSAVGSTEKVAEMKKELMEKFPKTMPGCSWIEVNNQVQTLFVGGDPRNQQIQAELNSSLGLMNNAGHMPITSSFLGNMNDEEKSDCFV